MKLTTVTMASLDGVMQGPGGSEEDRSEGFERGGWALPFFDGEGMTAMNDIYASAGGFLFGRRTFDIFARSWGTPEWVQENGLVDSPVASALNSRPKSIASSTLTDPKWSDSTVLSGDLAASIRDLKAKPGDDLVVPGSGALIRSLLDLELVESKSTTMGVTISVYRRAGRPEYSP